MSRNRIFRLSDWWNWAMNKNKNYRSNGTLKFSNKHFVIFIIVFIRILIIGHLLLTPTSEMTVLYRMMGTTDETDSSAVFRIAVRLPPFWSDWPAVWFAQAVVTFDLAFITLQRTKFNYVVSKLNQQQAAEAEHIIPTPPQQEPYDRLKAELLSPFSTSRERRVRQLH